VYFDGHVAVPPVTAASSRFAEMKVASKTFRSTIANIAMIM
jgi:hypothetical protein